MNRRWLTDGVASLRGVVVLTAALAAPRLVAAAEITDVADAADTIRIGNLQRDDPFDFYLGAEFENDLGTGKITREPIDRPGISPDDPNACTERNPRDCRPVDELTFRRVTNRLNVSGQIGIFHDLALSFGWHMVVSDSIKFAFADGVSGANSTVAPDTGTTLFSIPHSYYHRGSGAFDLGLKWAPLSDERDESKPSWVLYFNWSSPLVATTYNPAVDDATISHPATAGDGVHRLTGGMALSKRIVNFGLIGIDPNLPRRGYIDPYIDLSYTLPVPQRGRALAENLPASNFGSPPSHEARCNAGFEIVPVENLKNGYKLAVDLGLRSTYYSQGRNYSELTDALKELTYTDQYMFVGGTLGLYAQIAHFLRLKASFVAGYNTAHFLTNENVGNDVDGDNQVLAATDNINPYFCGNTDGDACPVDSYDQVGFRFRADRHLQLKFMLNMMFTF